MDVKTMHPRELGRGLMRGNASELKQGYSWESALKAVLEVRGIEPHTQEALELALYLDGFAKGMRGGWNDRRRQAMLDGMRDGGQEDRERILPYETDERSKSELERIEDVLEDTQPDELEYRQDGPSDTPGEQRRRREDAEARPEGWEGGESNA